MTDNPIKNRFARFADHFFNALVVLPVVLFLILVALMAACERDACGGRVPAPPQSVGDHDHQHRR